MGVKFCTVSHHEHTVASSVEELQATGSMFFGGRCPLPIGEAPRALDALHLHIFTAFGENHRFFVRLPKNSLFFK